VVALEASNALNTAKYIGPKNMLRAGTCWVMEAASYRFSYLETSTLLTFKVDGGGAETTVLAEDVLKDPGRTWQRVVMCASESTPGCGHTSPGYIIVSWTPGPGAPRVHLSLRQKPLGEILDVPGVSNPDEQLTHVTVTDITFLYNRTSTRKWSRQSVKKELQPHQPAPLPLPG